MKLNEIMDKIQKGCLIHIIEDSRTIFKGYVSGEMSFKEYEVKSISIKTGIYKKEYWPDPRMRGIIWPMKGEKIEKNQTKEFQFKDLKMETSLAIEVERIKHEREMGE